jgi:hypothetical protein
MSRGCDRGMAKEFWHHMQCTAASRSVTLQGGCFLWMSSSCDGVLPSGFATITASTVSAGLGHLHQGMCHIAGRRRKLAKQQELQQHGSTVCQQGCSYEAYGRCMLCL